MLARHVPERFRHNRPMWFARMAIVADRRAHKAHREGRMAWAALWRVASYSAKEGWRETRED